MMVGARYQDSGACEFVVWAPLATTVDLEIVAPQHRTIPMNVQERGYWHTAIDGLSPDTQYRFLLNKEKSRPDPASRFQPEGVHGPSQVINHQSFQWEDESWKGMELPQMIMYEIHIGAFTPEGTFDAIIPRLNELRELGITAIELMPVAQFPGERNWGYDGVYPFSVQASYGGPASLKRLVNACHQKGLAVILDVVYNHVGTEGNYLNHFGPYFTDRYKTPWGKAVNFDGAESDEVRRYFIQNALYWFEHFHIDALRLDAVHAIYDTSARPFLQELAEEVEAYRRATGKKHYLIAESDLNDTRLIRPRELGGFGLDAQWCDDLHHSLHTLLTGERTGYYVDFGTMDHLIKSLRKGYAYSGQYSFYRKRRHGNSALDRPASQFVVNSQTHDQVGNRMRGDRSSTLVSFEALKLAASVVILSPYLPLLFMGEEYGEQAPFLYFVSHSDWDLIEAVRRGRKKEFESFRWQGEPPDPQSPESFLASKLRWEDREKDTHKILREFYRHLLQLRKEHPVFAHAGKDHLDAVALEGNMVLAMRRWRDDHQIAALFSFDTHDRSLPNPLPAGKWRKILDSSDVRWSGPGTLTSTELTPDINVKLRKQSVLLLEKER